MLIFITGYMGAGKSLAGKKLAGLLNYNFFDLDVLIEQSTGKSIRIIFEEGGEDEFRRIERKVLMEHLDNENAVIATGGGTACYYNNMDLMNKNGVTVFLDTPLDIVIDRLMKDRQNRPLLNAIPENELPGFISGQYKERRKFYAQAQISIEKTDEKTLLEMISMIR